MHEGRPRGVPSCDRVNAPRATRMSDVMRPDASRVVGRPHIPGEQPPPEGPTRLNILDERIATMSDAQVRAELEDVRRRFRSRHRDLDRMLERNGAHIAQYLDG